MDRVSANGQLETAIANVSPVSGRSLRRFCPARETLSLYTISNRDMERRRPRRCFEPSLEPLFPSALACYRPVSEVLEHRRGRRRSISHVIVEDSRRFSIASTALVYNDKGVRLRKRQGPPTSGARFEEGESLCSAWHKSWFVHLWILTRWGGAGIGALLSDTLDASPIPRLPTVTISEMAAQPARPRLFADCSRTSTQQDGYATIMPSRSGASKRHVTFYFSIAYNNL